MLNRAARLNDVAALERLLDAGADLNATDRVDGMAPLHSACWTGQLEAAELLIERGASLTLKNAHGGDALGSAMHGSENCADVEGGTMMKLREEIEPRQYAAIVELLLAKGAPAPDHIWGGSDAVQETLRRHGVPEAPDGD